MEKIGVVGLLSYRCRDIGYGVEKDLIEGRFTGEVDSWGKRTFQPVLPSPPLYLFDDEILSFDAREVVLATTAEIAECLPEADGGNLLMPEQTIHTTENWAEMIAAMHSGEKTEIAEDVFDYFLDVLPPVYMGRRVTLPSGETGWASYGFAEGADNVTAFWTENGRAVSRPEGTRYFCQRTAEVNPYA